MRGVVLAVSKSEMDPASQARVLANLDAAAEALSIAKRWGGVLSEAFFKDALAVGDTLVNAVFARRRELSDAEKAHRKATRAQKKKKKKKMCLTLACRRLLRTSSLRPTGGGIVALSVDLSG